MIHPNNPKLDIEALKREIIAAAAEIEGKTPPRLPYRLNPAAAARRAEDIALHLATVERFLLPRQSLPPSLNRFPFNRLPVLQRGILKIFEYLFREQRLINQSLYATLRLMQKSNQELARAVDSLHRTIEDQDAEARAPSPVASAPTPAGGPASH